MPKGATWIRKAASEIDPEVSTVTCEDGSTYGYDALEPHIDGATMRVHHTGHHQTYTTNLNAALEKEGPGGAGGGPS